MFSQIQVTFVFILFILICTLTSLDASEEWVGGDGDGDADTAQVFMTSDFGPITISSFGGTPPSQELEDGKWFKVKTSSCTLDGMRVHSDFGVGNIFFSIHPNISSATSFGGRGKCGIDGIDEKTEVFIELDDNDVLGIKINTQVCLKHDLGVILLKHKVRVEDQSGWLIEKFFFKILQNVDMHAIMSEEKRQHRWLCIPEQHLVAMDPGFSLMGLTTSWKSIFKDAKVNTSLIAQWSRSSEDDMIVTTSITADYTNCTSDVQQESFDEDYDDSTAEVHISLDDEREWTLTIEINECIKSSGNFENEFFGNKPMRFRAKMEIKEGSIYSRLLVVARQYLGKKNVKNDKLKEILSEM